jgi:hypothetical protein
MLIKKRTKAVLLIVIIAILINVIIITVKFDITGNYEGLYLLRGELGALFELKDDFYLGEAYRYIAGVDLYRVKQRLHMLNKHNSAREPYLYYEWNEKVGEGYVRNYLTGGKQLITCFSRFRDEFDNKPPAGLFVGGGLPANVKEDNSVRMNATGMAYYDGLRWYHLWCSANEGIFDNLKPLYPFTWKYLGSKILHSTATELVLESNHEVLISSIPLLITRRAYFKAGDTFFLLTINIKNIGNRPVTYDYLYGDDPWVGNYGTSGGNVGWSGDGFYYFSGKLNTKKFNYAGYFDLGNEAIGQRHNFTWAANFIEWFGDIEPFVYFSNGPFDIPPLNNEKIPLSSNARFIGINWGARTLKPGQAETYTLAIGMAEHDPQTGFPVKPKVDLKNYP